MAAIIIAVIWGLQMQNRTVNSSDPGSGPSTAATAEAESEEIPQGMDEVDPADDPVEQAAPKPSNIPSAETDPESEPENLPKQAENVSEELVETANTQLDEFLESYSEVLAAPEEADENLTEDLEKTLQDAALGQVQASAAEYAANGWVMTGAPEIVASSVRELDEEAGPPTMTVFACVDSSPVKITTTTGTRVPSNAGRAMNIFELQQNDDESWVLVNMSFPDDPSC
ncbi:hypothetical protein [Glutamicibacter arilaitensis]|uniref:hypothetical protein n=1 Tax=Glutamicibacter arilaitensis TaxID=256701 RepID=UPI003F8F0272